MKVVSPQQMAELEQLAYRDGASEQDFMEEAGSGVALLVHDYAELNNDDRHVILLCGKGNNAGDAFVAGKQLLQLDYDVTAYLLFPLEQCSPLCQENHFQFINSGGKTKEVQTPDDLVFPPTGIIIDGIFGTGFYGPIQEPIAAIIDKANRSNLPIFAVDIPSGLNGNIGTVEGEAIIATHTAFLGLPKTGFFLRDGWNHVGKLSYVDFGLSKHYFDSIKEEMQMLSPDLLRPLLPPVIRNRHKYQAGHVVGLAGSPSMPGAALLASLAALCSGAGIVHLLHHQDMRGELATIPYELIRMAYDPNNINPIVELLNKATSTFIGPGLGVSNETRSLLSKVIPQLTQPTVIDADALTILSEENIPFPENAILTPHLGEMKRLLNVSQATLDMDFLKVCQEYAYNNRITLILKGGPSFIFHDQDLIMVSPKGDPGMATAGSGDVLAGLIASLLSQKLTCKEAALLGVYLHGIAGEKAATELTSYCMTASDIITYFPHAFNPNNWTE